MAQRLQFECRADNEFNRRAGERQPRQFQVSQIQGNPLMTDRQANHDNVHTATVRMEELGQLVDHLNEDLAGELQSIIMYVEYAALLRALHRSDLSELLQKHIPDLQRRAKLLAEQISALKGTPTTLPRPVPRAVGAHQMLRNIFERATRAVDDYTDRVAEAALNRESGLKAELERLVDDATRHRNEVGNVLAGSTESGFNSQPT
jgi:bacterioferritin